MEVKALDDDPVSALASNRVSRGEALIGQPVLRITAREPDRNRPSGEEIPCSLAHRSPPVAGNQDFRLQAQERGPDRATAPERTICVGALTLPPNQDAVDRIVVRPLPRCLPSRRLKRADAVRDRRLPTLALGSRFQGGHGASLPLGLRPGATREERSGGRRELVMRMCPSVQ